MLAELQFGTDKSSIINRDWLKVYARQVVNLQHPTLLRVFDVCLDDQDRWVLVRQAQPRKWRWLYDRSVTANRNELVTIASVLLSVSEALSYLHQAQFRGLNFSAWYESARTTESVDGELHFGMMPPTPIEAFKNSETSYMGSLAYSAPEALLCFTTPKDFVYRPPTPESDSYSLGCLLFELLTGERLINAPDIEGAVRQVTSPAFPTLQKMRPDLPAETSDFVTRALSHSPEARPALRDWSLMMEASGGRLLTTASFSEGLPQSNVDPQAATPKLVSVLEDEGLSQRIRIIAPIGTGAMVSEYLAEVSIDASDEERTVSMEPTLSAAAENEAITKELQLPPVDSLMFRPPPPTQEFAPPPPVTGQLPADYATEPDTPLYLDENVQFTVYRPKAIVPQKWFSLLAFAHLSEKREDATEDEPDPVAEVRQQAEAILGEQAADYQNLTQDTLQAIPREGTITFVPTMPGIEFNPPSRSFTWEESVHREDFRLRTNGRHVGQTLRGRLSVFLGSILLADISLSIRVDSHQAPKQKTSLEETHARPYRKIFASYSHRDIEVVEQFERFAEALGDRYLRDVTYLRAGEAWSEKLEEMIVKADIFQLFWSSNSMSSPFVRQEWEYALSLQRPNFIRPTYWEEPLPAKPEQKLPPEELMRLHFQRIHSGADSERPAPRPTEGGMPTAGSAPSFAALLPPPAPMIEPVPLPPPSSMIPPPPSPTVSPLPPLSSMATTRSDAMDESPLSLPPPPPTMQFPLDDFPSPPSPTTAPLSPLPSMAMSPPQSAPLAAPPPPVSSPILAPQMPDAQYSGRSGSGERLDFGDAPVSKAKLLFVTVLIALGLGLLALAAVILYFVFG